jgi:hypothetical protein
VDIDEFWHLIDLIGGADPQTLPSGLADLEDALVRRDETDVVAFGDHLSLQLYNLDRRDLAESGPIRLTNGTIGLSDDSFLYLRCAVVCDGRVAYHTVLDDLVEFRRYLRADLLIAEELLYTDTRAIERKTGREDNRRRPYSTATGSNELGWLI